MAVAPTRQRWGAEELARRIADLQLEFFADDLVPPEADVFEWSDAQLVRFFESGGADEPRR